MPPGYRCGLKPHQDSWCVAYKGKHWAKRSFKKYGGEDGAVRELAQQAWSHAQSLDVSLVCPHTNLFGALQPAMTASATISNAAPAAMASTSSSSSSSAVIPHLLTAATTDGLAIQNGDTSAMDTTEAISDNDLTLAEAARRANITAQASESTAKKRKVRKAEP